MADARDINLSHIRLHDARDHIYKNMSLGTLAKLGQTSTVFYSEIEAHLSNPARLIKILNQSTPQELAGFLRQYFDGYYSSTNNYSALTRTAQSVKKFITDDPASLLSVCFQALTCNDIKKLNLQTLEKARLYAIENGLENIANSISAIQLARSYISFSGATIHFPLNCYFNFAGAHLQKINLTKADVRYANFNLASLMLATLTECNMQGANLSFTNFNHTSAVKANFSNAILFNTLTENANFSDANLFNASVISVRLHKMNLTNANLNGIRMTNPIQFQYVLARNFSIHLDNIQANIVSHPRYEDLKKALREDIIEHVKQLKAENRQIMFDVAYQHSIFQNTLTTTIGHVTNMMQRAFCLFAPRNWYESEDQSELADALLAEQTINPRVRQV